MGKRNHVYAVALPDSSTTLSGSRWAILVQPKQVTKWFRAENPPASIYAPSGKLPSVPDASHLLAKLLIGDNNVPSIETHIQETLQRVSVSEEDSSSWLPDAVAALQRADLVSDFNVEEFGIVCADTLAAAPRDGAAVVELDHLGRPLRLASPGLEDRVAAIKQKEEKKQGGGFWISHGPNAATGLPRKARQRNSWEREDDAYGGLM